MNNHKTQVGCRFTIRAENYEPLVADLTNFGSWTDAGARTSTERATAVWQRTLADYRQPLHGAEAAERIAAFVARRIAEGGARPVD